MKNMTNRVLIASLLLSPGILFAKPKKKGKKKPKPAVEEQAQATEDLNEPSAIQDAANKVDSVAADATQGYSAGYGMAGCGFGSYVLKEDGILQIFAATTNGIVGNQTFGITFGTLQCKGSAASVSQEQKVFIDANLVSIKREAASGQGETLMAFADLLGCDAAQFSEVSKANYGSIYKSTESNEILAGYKAVLNNQCARLI